LIPHDFGRGSIPPIDTIEMVKQKINLMDTLDDLEVAANVMKTAEESKSEDDETSRNYSSLGVKITALDKNGDLYKLLHQYAHNSHDSAYFSLWDIEVLDIFEVERPQEIDRFKKWEDNHNKMLLWHGSRLTNWVGILSQGLRIAPPEAPKTGYRFGKGIYLADCISKSGSYCFTNESAPHAVMILNECGLGNMNELKKDEYMEKAPQGKDSTKALGMAAPDPKSNTKIGNTVVPVGKIVNTGIKSACTHNEYIVYDVAQVKIKYIFKLKFNHKKPVW